MLNNSEKQTAIVKLVSELCEKSPNLKRIQDLCKTTGYKYSPNLIELMSDVLMADQQIKKTNKSKTEKGFEYET